MVTKNRVYNYQGLCVGLDFERDMIVSMTDVDFSGRVSAEEIVERLKKSGGLGELFDAVGAGGVELTGKGRSGPGVGE